MDFYQILERQRGKVLEIYPDFRQVRSKDLMVRGRSFYAIWDEERQIWSTDEADVQRLVDKALDIYYEKRKQNYDGPIEVKRMISFSSNSWRNYRAFLREMFDTYKDLDESLTFSNTEAKKNSYISKRLPYPLAEGSIDAYDELISTLYDQEERDKLEWAIGSIISGESKKIQKFIVLYGEAGSGKSTFLNIIQKMFDGYYVTFEARALTNQNNSFATEVFKNNPLIAIQHDGDLSRIEDNTKLNSIISHEEMVVNEKFKAQYTAKSNAFLFMGTNKPVKITDAKSGIIRRLIDVRPSGNKVSTQRYHTLVEQINFELGAIAYHCLKRFKKMGKNYYSDYKPLEMMYQTDVFFNFVEDSYFDFKKEDGVTLQRAYEMYKNYCDETLVEYKLARHKFRDELKSYFKTFNDRCYVDGKQVRNYYSGFIHTKIIKTTEESDEEIKGGETNDILVLDKETSILDGILKNRPAQYANENETPINKWDNVKTTLKDIDTGKVHYVRPPENHIVIDFDIKDEKGKKSSELNLKAAGKWPPTYAEFSKGGSGVHLHYIYEGDVGRLTRIFEEDVEIKVFSGKSSLRRRLTKCNDIPIATISSGLPLKGERMINFEGVKSEKKLRSLITRNLNKEIHPGTKPSIDFIHKLLEDAYSSGMSYDVTDMRQQILIFAMNSTNQADYCMKLVENMRYASEEPSESTENYDSDELIFYDVEVFPNLFVVVWKKEGGEKVNMINPSPEEIGELLKFKLVGFNCRRYDNHILYARYIGYTIPELYSLSQKIISNSRQGLFREAYSISYTDVYDFSSVKQSLKKFEIELGLKHLELGLPWDEPVEESLWEKVVEYCGNDVDATEAVFKARHEDFVARLILSELSGLTPNDTTQTHTAKIIFGNEREPQKRFNYTDLSGMFPGYTFERGKSQYRGEEPGEGGYVYAEPGMYSNVFVFDVASMHPTSAIALDIFGPYTKNFKELVDARLAIKHEDYEKAKVMLNGALAKHLDSDPKGLSHALKIVINIVYGLTSAKFENKFKDPRNIDNIVAKRGALFMIDLKNEVEARGFKAIHIKTDSIKIANATKEITDFIFEFGEKYGYSFEQEVVYEKFCLVNDAVFISKVGWTPNGRGVGDWIAVGAQFAHPYVFKTLFSREKIEFEDLCETKAVTSSLYLDMNEDLPDVSVYEKEYQKLLKDINNPELLNDDEMKQKRKRADELRGLIEKGHDYRFIGKVGLFCPIKEGCGGGTLLREKDGKYYAVAGSKGYRWLESDMVSVLGREDDIDRRYHDSLVDDAVDKISSFGDIEWFIENQKLAECGKNASECNSDCSEKSNCKHLPF